MSDTPYVVAGCPIPNGRSLDLLTRQVRALGEQTRRPDALLYVTYGEVPEGVDENATANAIMEGLPAFQIVREGAKVSEPYLQRLVVESAGPADIHESEEANWRIHWFLDSTFLEKFPEATHLLAVNDLPSAESGIDPGWLARLLGDRTKGLGPLCGYETPEGTLHSRAAIVARSDSGS